MTSDMADGADTNLRHGGERDAGALPGGVPPIHSGNPDHLGRPRPRVLPIETRIRRGAAAAHRARGRIVRVRGAYGSAKTLQSLQPADHEKPFATPISSRLASRFVKAIRSPVLTNVGVAALLYVISFHPSFDLAGMVSSSFVCPGAKPILVATVDFIQDEVTPTIQAFLTGRLTKWIGLTLLFALFPALGVLRVGTMAKIRALATSALARVRRRRRSCGAPPPRAPHELIV
ncbi:hypothetical protein [Bradyrhizobium sp. DOA9]|uniref:hypothetical protein n=1 Tax=Bradyrhizobium sp. DOA9 TaxID=1126627 RepID=UPI0007234944|nr:hypothetical protein [Bradyrhizobium sp. DOA9]GAJ36931.1 hypothetical protein BDOA9_0161490 [Bradyrhizobium sp. DOA9]